MITNQPNSTKQKFRDQQLRWKSRGLIFLTCLHQTNTNKILYKL